MCVYHNWTQTFLLSIKIKYKTNPRIFEELIILCISLKKLPLHLFNFYSYTICHAAGVFHIFSFFVTQVFINFNMRSIEVLMQKCNKLWRRNLMVSLSQKLISVFSFHVTYRIRLLHALSALNVSRYFSWNK